MNKCMICQKSGSLACSENCRIRIIEAAKIRHGKVYGRLMSSSLDADFKYHMENSYAHKKVLERIKVSFFVDH